MTGCDKGGGWGSKNAKNSVTYFMDGATWQVLGQLLRQNDILICVEYCSFQLTQSEQKCAMNHQKDKLSVLIHLICSYFDSKLFD